jgi:transcriptional regulator
MYIPPVNAETDADALFAFMETHSFGLLLSQGSGGELVATHMPWVVHRARGPRGVLEGHIARANTEHGAPTQPTTDAGEPSDAWLRGLVILTGPDAYISPSWYPSTAEHGKVVPTWNYIAVHVYGTFRLTTDTTFLRRHLEDLVIRHEGQRPAPWSIDDAPAAYIERQLRAIVGIEFRIERIEGKWKMSQNRNAADIDGVISGLRQSANPTDREVAEIVALRRRS